MTAAPALFDRLVDLDPASKSEAAQAGEISPRRMREIIRRDLAALLGSIRLSDREDLSAYPLVERSALNFGIRDYSGSSSDALDPSAAGREIREAILIFEPRLEPRSLEVSVELRGDGEARDIVGMTISGVYLGAGEPVSLSAEIHLETGAVRLVDEAER